MLTILAQAARFDRLPIQAVTRLEQAQCILLQSGVYGCGREIAQRYAQAQALDALFEECADFDVLCERVCAEVMSRATQADVVFCINGLPHQNLFARALMRRTDCTVLAGGVLDEALARAVCFFELDGFACVDAREIAGYFPDTSKALVVTGVDNTYQAVETKLRLSEYYAQSRGVWFCAGEAREVALLEIDRIQTFEEGGILIFPAVPLECKTRFGLYDIVAIMQRLRDVDGCPWDAEQTHRTLRQFLLEEAYEAVQAIDDDDMFALYDELGDVLLQIAFHAQIGAEYGAFDIDDVASAVCSKMILRHPHVFGDVQVSGSGDVLKNWEEIKKKEKGNETYTSVLRDIPQTMGAMMRAFKIQKKAGNVGFDWDDALPALEKVKEETAEFEAELAKRNEDLMEQEAGDWLFAIINVLRLLKINPEVALSRTCEKFIRRFAYMEEHAAKSLKELTLAEMDALWEQAKQKL